MRLLPECPWPAKSGSLLDAFFALVGVPRTNALVSPQMSRIQVHCRVLLLVALPSWACSPSIEPIVVGTGCPENPLRGPEQYSTIEPPDGLVSDFEGGSTQLARVANRDGYWIFGRDLTSKSVTIQPSNACAARGQWSGHFAASEPTEWGNNWIALFKSGSAESYDGSSYNAVSFWAAQGGDADYEPVPFGIVTTDTIRPSCSTYCQDHYMKSITLTHSWTRYELRFDDLAQSSNPGIPMRQDALAGFIIWPRHECDIWIDDIRLEP